LNFWGIGIFGTNAFKKINMPANVINEPTFKVNFKFKKYNFITNK